MRWKHHHSFSSICTVYVYETREFGVKYFFFQKQKIKSVCPNIVYVQSRQTGSEQCPSDGACCRRIKTENFAAREKRASARRQESEEKLKYYKKRAGKILILNLYNKRIASTLASDGVLQVATNALALAHPKAEKQKKNQEMILIFITRKIIYFFYFFVPSPKQEIRKVIYKSPHCTYRLCSTGMSERSTAWLLSIRTLHCVIFSRIFYSVVSADAVKLNSVVDWSFIVVAVFTVFSFFIFEPLKTKTPSICCC